MGFGVFLSDAEVVDAGFENESTLWNFEMLNLVVLLGIENALLIGGQILAQMHVVAIGAKAFAAVRFDNDGAIFNGLENCTVSEDHDGTQGIKPVFQALVECGLV